MAESILRQPRRFGPFRRPIGAQISLPIVTDTHIECCDHTANFSVPFPPLDAQRSATIRVAPLALYARWTTSNSRFNLALSQPYLRIQEAGVRCLPFTRIDSVFYSP